MMTTGFQPSTTCALPASALACGLPCVPPATKLISTFVPPVCFTSWNTLSPDCHMLVPFSRADLSSAVPSQVALRECQERGQDVLAEMGSTHLS